MVAGALITSTVKLKLGLHFGEGDGAIVLQDTLDKVLPNMLPLILTLVCLYLMKKWNGKYVVSMIFVIIGVSIFLSYFGIIV